MPRKNAVRHGTPQGYKKHLKKDNDWDNEPCYGCRAAHKKEIAEYREKAGRDRAADTRRTTARRRALGRLVEEYPENVGRYETLLKQELDKMEESR